MGCHGCDTHAKHIVYKLKKVFVNSKKEKRIYHEMWTGQWWNTIQVFLYFLGIRSDEYHSQKYIPEGACVAP